MISIYSVISRGMQIQKKPRTFLDLPVCGSMCTKEHIDIVTPDVIDRMVALYNSTLRDLVDEHAPVKRNEMLRRPLLLLYNRT